MAIWLAEPVPERRTGQGEIEVIVAARAAERRKGLRGCAGRHILGNVLRDGLQTIPLSKIGGIDLQGLIRVLPGRDVEQTTGGVGVVGLDLCVIADEIDVPVARIDFQGEFDRRPD